jgi:hypothetical protein
MERRLVALKELDDIYFAHLLKIDVLADIASRTDHLTDRGVVSRAHARHARGVLCRLKQASRVGSSRRNLSKVLLPTEATPRL